MAKVRVLGIVTLVAALLGAVSVAHAGIIAYNVGAGEPGNQVFGGSLGLDFDVLAPINVSSLGVFDASQDGISGTLHAQIFNRSTTSTVTLDLLFTSASPGTLINGSRFKPIPGGPVSLPVGNYSIVAWGFSSTDLNGNIECVGNAGCSGPTNTFNLSGLNDGGGLIAFTGLGRFATTPGAFPNIAVTNPPFSNATVNTFHAGTLMYSAPVPEPGTLLLIGSGLVGIGVGSRRRSRRK